VFVREILIWVRLLFLSCIQPCSSREEYLDSHDGSQDWSVSSYVSARDRPIEQLVLFLSVSALQKTDAVGGDAEAWNRDGHLLL